MRLRKLINQICLTLFFAGTSSCNEFRRNFGCRSARSALSKCPI